MNAAIRWRIVTLQAVLVVVLAAASGFAFFEGNFITGMIHDQLVAQKVFFPAADQIKENGALDPKIYPQEIRDQAGNQVVDGNQARIYANDFIGEHLKHVANGETYASQGAVISGLNAQLATLPKDSAGYADLQKRIATANGQRDTLFKGEMLRGTLLNAYGWWTFGTYLTYAAIGLLLMALVVLGALVYELFFAGQPKRVAVSQQAAA